MVVLLLSDDSWGEVHTDKCSLLLKKMRKDVQTPPHTNACAHTHKTLKFLPSNLELYVNTKILPKEQTQLHVWLSSTLAGSHLQTELTLCWRTQTTARNMTFSHCYTQSQQWGVRVSLVTWATQHWAPWIWTQRGSVRQRNGSSSSSRSPALPCTNTTRQESHRETLRYSAKNTQLLQGFFFFVCCFWLNSHTDRKTQSEDDNGQWRKGRGMKRWREGRRMYLDPIYWIMDDSCLRLLEEEWRERVKERGRGGVLWW